MFGLRRKRVVMVPPPAGPSPASDKSPLRYRLLKIGARVIEKAARIRIHLASARSDAALFRMLVGRLGTVTAGATCPANPRPFNPQP